MRRWRGTIDVPPTKEGLRAVEELGDLIYYKGGLDLVWHDGLKRCKKTAKALGFPTKKHFGPRPWNMGTMFEGHEITEESLDEALFFIRTDMQPKGGEPFSQWYLDWLTFVYVQNRERGNRRIGIVTHNRNIQFLYAWHNGEFHYPLYDCHGPDFLSVHYYSDGHIAPWNGRETPPGLYLIRHSETEWGT